MASNQTEESSDFRPTYLTNDENFDDDRPLSKNRRNLKKWLGRKIRVVLHSQRILIGTFSCTDRDKNVVLSNCGIFGPESDTPISVGMFIVAGHQIASISVDMPAERPKQQLPLEEVT